MKIKNWFLGVLFILTCCASSLAQQSEKVVPPPEDKPVNMEAEQTRKFEEAIKPYVEEAKRTYPEAKTRFLAGLPPKEHFYITTRLRDKSGRFEQSFIKVTAITEGIVKGTIANEITLVTKYKLNDEYSFPESEIIDWTITKADGSEEGNVVGKFLDTYKP